MQTSSLEGKAFGKSSILLLIFLLTILCVLFHRSFDSNEVLFANDVPLGAAKAEQSRLPATLTGNWQDINWIGGEGVSAAPDVTALVGTLFSPEFVLKFYPPLSMLLLGLSVWLCFRELRFRPIVCLLGGLAAGLNMHAFSFACWGLSHWVIAIAMMFLAVAALVSQSISRGWMRGILAGMAVGIGLMEGFDVGAINSLYIGIFGLFTGMVGKKLSTQTFLKSALIVAVMAVFAGLTAAHTLSSLVSTQIKATAIRDQDESSKENQGATNKTAIVASPETEKAEREEAEIKKRLEREKQWWFVTQWSLPKKETLRILIPGIFGYRMDTEGTGIPYEKSYWGWVAQTPGFEDPGENYHKGQARHSGSGEYSGIFVLLVAILAIAQSFRKQNSPFTPEEKKFIRFWAIIALVSLLLAFGRHAPFFQIIFALPFLSSIRSTLKYLNPFHVALLILFGYGLESMARRYFETAKNNLATAFEKKWKLISGASVGVALLSWMIYASSKKDLLNYLGKNFPSDIAAQIAEFSIGEMGWFVLFFAASVALVWMVLSGKFAGKLKPAGILMGVLIVADLSHADMNWIVYQNYKTKYQTNPIIETLRKKPYEQRVVGMLPLRVNDTLSSFQQFYFTEWLQHHFYFYNIQTLDVPQNPRPAADNTAYQQNFYAAEGSGLVRMWQLTNVRYLFGLTGEFVDFLNQRLDPEQKRFKMEAPFNISQETQGGAYLVQTNSTGPFALIEFSGALPRAKLYSNWQVVTNDQNTLQELVDPKFNPFQSVLIADEIPAPSAISTNANAGTVEITSYHPKQIELVAKATAPSILLFNDKFNPNWKVTVDGKEKPLLRANFIMRGVQLDQGEHKIEFRFQPPLTTLYVSLAGIAIGLGLLAFVVVGKKREKPIAPKI